MALAAACTLLFIVYGSLVPFRFAIESAGQAWDALASEAFQGSARRSLTDWLTNFALYVPLSFTAFGALHRRGRPGRNLLAAIAVMAGCAAVSMGVEAAQVYLPARVSAWSDLAWNIAGAGVGLVGWMLAGRIVSARLDRLAHARALPAHRFGARLAAVATGFYLVAVAAANGWMRHAWLGIEAAVERAGEFAWLPFYYHHDANIVMAGISALKYALLYAPAGVLCLLAQLRRPQTRPFEGLRVAVWATALLAAALEFSKLFLTGLRPDTGNILVAALGAGAGWLFVHGLLQAGMSHRAAAADRPAGPSRRHAVGLEMPRASRAEPRLTNDPAVQPQGEPAHEGTEHDRTESRRTSAASSEARSEDQPARRHRTRRRRHRRPRTHSTGLSGMFEGVRKVILASFAVMAAVIAAWGTARYPLGWALLAVALVLYGAILWRHPAAWLVALPALLPILDLTPWSGWYYLTEFDLFVAVTLAIGLASAAAMPTEVRMPRRIKWLLALFTLSCLVSLAIGILPLQPLDHAAFSSYFSRYAALLPAKALLSVLLLIPLASRAIERGTDVRGLFAAGMALGLLGVCVVALWERIAYPGLLDFNRVYRIAASFSTMNTGGGHVEGYLVLALPFVVAAIYYIRAIALRVALGLLFALGSYVLLVTFSRGGYAAFAFSLVVLLATIGASALRRSWARRALIAPVLLALIASLVAVPVLEGRFIRSRLATATEDWGTRVAHWRDVLAMMNQDWTTTAFGMGLGRFPETYFYRGTGARPSAPFRYSADSGNTFLRIGVGAPLYIEQIVAIAPHRNYVLNFDARSDGEQPVVNALLCERSYFFSAGCASAVVKLRGEPGQWQRYTAEINSGKLGGTPWYAHRPVKLSLENASRAATVDIDNLQLAGNDRRDLVTNGDFSRGSARWYFSSAFNHLPWHIENLALEIYFSQGLIGLGAFVALVLVSAIWMAHAALRGDLYSCVVLAALAGFLTVGIFNSLLEAPRLMTILLLVLVLWALTVRRPAAVAAQPAMPQPQRAPSAPDADASVRASVPVEATAGARAAESATASDSRAEQRPSNAPWPAHVPWLHLAAGMFVCAVLGWIVTHAPMVPYNVRELFNPSHPYIGLTLLSAFVYWSFGVPALVAHRKPASPPIVWLLPALVLVHAWVAWFLLHLAVLPESIHDLVGSPVLGWPWEWERMGRFMALFVVLSLQMAGAVLLIAARERSGLAPALIAWAVTSMAVLPLAWWIVVPMAASDNLVELIADSGALGSSALAAAWLFVIAFTGSSVAAAVARIGRNAWLRAVVITLLSLPIAWVLLTQATEAVIVKGRQSYSALQFLLSVDRRNLAAGADLVWRYAVVHVAIVGMIGWVQYPFWLYLRRRREV